MVFVADDLGAWLVGLLADAGRRKLTALVLGSDQERALRSAAAAAIHNTAAEMSPTPDQADLFAMVISEVFGEPVGDTLTGRSMTILEGMEAGIAQHLDVLDDANRTGTGQSSAEILGVPGAVLAEKLTGYLVREIMLRGSSGGPLTPVADQLNHDLTHLQGQRVEGILAQLTGLIAAASAPWADASASPQELRSALSARAVLVRDSDPRRLGVHAAISVPEIPEEVPPEYVPRDVDAAEQGLRAKLAAAAQRGGFILLVGGSSVGKTRCAVEAVKTVLPDWSLLHPAGADEIAALAQAPPPQTVLWLDELQRYLDGPSGLTGGVVRALLNSPHAVVIIGTLWPDRYAAHTVMPYAGTADLHAREREVLDLAAVIRIDAAFSPAEQERAHAAGTRDRRLEIALKSAGYGLTQTLAAAPQLVARWEDAPAASPYGWAVLTAALDAARLGTRVSLSSEFLRAAAPGYCTSRQQAEAPENWFEQALAYATGKLHGAVAALSPTGTGMGQVTGYAAADYLIQHASQHRRGTRVPDGTWNAFLSHIRDPADAARLADSAGETALHRYAIPLYRRAADAGISSAMYSLGFLLQEQGNLDQAEQWYRKAAEAGHFGAMSNMAVLLGQRGQAEEADHWYSLASAGGQITPPKPRRERKPGQAERLRREAAEGNAAAMHTLGELHEEEGNTEQAEEWYRQAAHNGETRAMDRLARLLDKTGRQDQAEQWYRRAADSGQGWAMNNFGLFLTSHDRPDQAEQWLRKAAASGGMVAAGAMYNLGHICEKQGHADQAEQWYRNSAALGHSAAMTDLGSLLLRIGHVEQAEYWYSKAIAAGDANAVHKLRDLGNIVP
ncbi:sel1 repeat family protein [Trebonia kvetii]|uniref:Sel1 repeat family protein n=1 Tax=Trebonia kvetii TaxID=2480626 RepID=A0A6P2BZB5_9ACTN|nr:tetratricopeptide repeat protein [Trebonia kvetii]TVZ03535.1 sel1 repeat family protein [Trebonia kvetii]